MIIEAYVIKDDLASQALVPLCGGIFQRFYESRTLWQDCLVCIAELDCLQSLMFASTKLGPGATCRPEFISNEGNQKDEKVIMDPYLYIEEMKHPVLAASNVNKIVANTIELGTPREPARTLLVTGPNMGGKSTLLRQTCLAVVLAQMGCYVPAKKVKLTPVDRIFSRIGAHDRILEGKSTFFIEMEEVKAILESGSINSLAVVDEFGRGTSTFDGYSLAHAVLTHLIKKMKMRSLFATHYHKLPEDFMRHDNINNYRMDIIQK